MKHFLSFLLAAALILALAACGAESPTDEPSDGLTLDLSSYEPNAPTAAPTSPETAAPTSPETAAPTSPETAAPTEAPTVAPTEAPTVAPTEAPTDPETAAPTAAPTEAPTAAQTEAPFELGTTGAEYADVNFASSEMLEADEEPYQNGALYDMEAGTVEITDAVSLYDLCPTVGLDNVRVYALVSDNAVLSQKAAAALAAMCEAAYNETGMRVHVRTAAHMKSSDVGYADYTSLKSVKIGYYDAGKSLYHAFDEADTRPIADFIRENAYKYGFVDLSSAGDAGHFRYVGVPHAAAMRDKGFTSLADYHAYLDSLEKVLKISLDGVTYYVRSYAVLSGKANVEIPTAYKNAYELSATGNGSLVLTVSVYASGLSNPLPYVADQNADRSGAVICLDAGHGAHDPGAVWPQTGTPTYLEKDYNLAVALEAKAYLEAMGYTVVLTRSDDTFVELTDRVSFAKSKGADLFISFHCNSVDYPDSPTAVGPQVYFNQSNATQYLNWTTARTFRNAINTATAAYIASGAAHPVEESDLRSGGHYVVLSDKSLPSVLLEMGFITNGGDRALFENSAWCESMGYAAAMAVETLFANDHLGVK